MNELHFGDNLDVLRAMPAESVDLIYLDPPFNSNATYNVLYGTKRGGASKAQSHAFADTWSWGPVAQRALDETADRHLQAGSILDAFYKLFGGSNMMAYLAMMGVRLIELHRVLTPAGSLYLHCDPTASHYLKILLDGIFGARSFRNEIVWLRSKNPKGSQHASKKYSPHTDSILYYGKSDEAPFFADDIRLGPVDSYLSHRMVAAMVMTAW
jgi:adenine specific DNA methylase Mod